MYFDNLEYTKKNISLQISKCLRIEYDEILFVLSRGKLGKLEIPDKIQGVFKILLNQYKQIINEIKSNLNLIVIPVDLNQYQSNSIDFVINEFIKSPEKPTPELCDSIDIRYRLEGSLNKIFELKSFGWELLPKSLLEHVHLENQRSLEWLDLLKFYHCGNSINNTIPFVNCETNFNLVRGCLGEKLLIDLIDWANLVGEPVSKCMCGLLVETKQLLGSKGIAPDLLLINNNSNQVIPVEIKTLVSDPNIINRKFLREIKLASKQLDTSIGLIENICGIKTYGLIVFCYIHSNQIYIKYKKYYFI